MRWTVSGADKAGLCQQPVNEDKRGGGGGLLEVRSIIYLSPSLFVALCVSFSLLQQVHNQLKSLAVYNSGGMLSSAGVQVQWTYGYKSTDHSRKSEHEDAMNNNSFREPQILIYVIFPFQAHPPMLNVSLALLLLWCLGLLWIPVISIHVSLTDQMEGSLCFTQVLSGNLIYGVTGESALFSALW